MLVDSRGFEFAFWSQSFTLVQISTGSLGSSTTGEKQSTQLFRELALPPDKAGVEVQFDHLPAIYLWVYLLLLTRFLKRWTEFIVCSGEEEHHHRRALIGFGKETGKVWCCWEAEGRFRVSFSKLVLEKKQERPQHNSPELGKTVKWTP